MTGRSGPEPGSKRQDFPPEVEAFRHTQSVARRAARRTFEGLEEGVTEREAAAALEAELRREGIRCWLHKPFAWFGDRTCFTGFRRATDFLPSRRRLKKDHAVILDMGPAIDGFPCDYAFSGVFGEDAEVAAMKACADGFMDKIIGLLDRDRRGFSVVRAVNAEIEERGYGVRHRKYPLRVLGHKLERYAFGDRLGVGFKFQFPFFLMTATQLYRGENPFLNEYKREALEGVWAIEPHLGNGRVGAKFEELLWVHKDGAEWLL
jgi:Xaa-Pro aminopeptidase